MRRCTESLSRLLKSFSVSTCKSSLWEKYELVDRYFFFLGYFPKFIAEGPKLNVIPFVLTGYCAEMLDQKLKFFRRIK